MGKKNLAIIGNGMATCRLLDELVRRDGLRHFDVTVFGEESGGAYNRVLLSRVLAGDEPDAIVTKPGEWYDQHGVRLVSNTRVARVDPLKRAVLTEDGRSRRYDVAVLATGSQPLVPPLEGMMLDGELRPGVFVYRTVADCLRMRAHARPGDNAIVLGGGLLGLEAAKVLADRGLHVTVVHVAATLMNAQLDEVGGDMLRRQVERCGIFVRTGRTVEAVYGDDTLGGVILDDGTTLPADMVVLACGVRPRVEVARASNVPVNKGIVVNDALATEVPGVYALGECAEHRGRIYGIVAPVWDQAAVLADVLTGGRARYRGSKLYTRLKVAGIEVASMGAPDPESEDDQVFQVIEERKDAYRKLVVREGRLVGAMLVGNTAAAGDLVQLFDRGDPLPDDPLEALCRARGVAAARDRIVCTCHKVTDVTIRAAIAGGCASVAEVGEVTRAGTGCGSCRAQVAEIIEATPRSPKALPIMAAG